MNIDALKGRVNTLVRLSFADGEVVEAWLIGVDPMEHEDLTYELRRIVRPGEPPARGSEVGAIVVAPLADLTEWQVA